LALGAAELDFNVVGGGSKLKKSDDKKKRGKSNQLQQRILSPQVATDQSSIMKQAGGSLTTKHRQVHY
jgi:hypothetical protein